MTLQKVSPGQPLRIAAKDWNILADMSRGHAFGRAEGGAETTDPTADRIIVRNTSGADLDRLSVLGLTDPIFSPTDNERQFAEPVVAMVGGAPVTATHGANICVLAEPIKNGSLGEATLLGITAVKINVTDEGHATAAIDDGNTARLKSASSGPFHILWKEAGTGLKYAWVYLAGGSGSAAPSSIIVEATISSHGYSVGTTVGLSGGSWSAVVYNRVRGIVSKVIDADNVEITIAGLVDGLSGLSAGVVYYASGSSTLTDQRPAVNVAVQEVLAARDATSGVLILGSDINKNKNEIYVSQSNHGFIKYDVLYRTASGFYAKAIADGSGKAYVIGMVSDVIDDDNFALITHGYLSFVGVTEGQTYWLSPTTAGAITTVKPKTEVIHICDGAQAACMVNIYQENLPFFSDAEFENRVISFFGNGFGTTLAEFSIANAGKSGKWVYEIDACGECEFTKQSGSSKVLYGSFSLTIRGNVQGNAGSPMTSMRCNAKFQQTEYDGGVSDLYTPVFAHANSVTDQTLVINSWTNVLAVTLGTSTFRLEVRYNASSGVPGSIHFRWYVVNNLESINVVAQPCSASLTGSGDIS